MAAAFADDVKTLHAGVRIANKLELVRRVGEGGMGAVWIAKNLATEAAVAIKVLRHDRRTEESVARFRHEAHVGAALAHRNITRVFDLVEEDGSLYLVMEVLCGHTLGDHRWASGKLSNKEAVAIVVPVLTALQHAHDRGIVHRDLKPSNVFLAVEPDGYVTPKLLDFGIAKSPDSVVETRTGDAIGTPSYMSPEQVRAADLDGKSDLWAVGVVLYELITGATPFAARTSTAVLAQVLELEVDPDPRIEPRLWLEIQRALRKQAYERHASAKEMAAALSAAIGESEASLAELLRRDPTEAASLWAAISLPTASLVDRPPAAMDPPPRSRSRKNTVAVAGTVGLALACGFAWRASFGTAPPSPTRAAAMEATSAEPSAVSAPAVAVPAVVEDAKDVTGPASSVAPALNQKRAHPQGAPSTSNRPLARTPGF